MKILHCLRGVHSRFDVSWSRRASSPFLLACAYAVLSIVACGGCDESAPRPSPPPPPPIPARPIIVSERTETHVFADNQEIIQVKNEGDAGLVECSVNWMETKTTYTSERGESGAEKVLRETFTRKPEPPSETKENSMTYCRQSWTSKKMMQKGETSEFAIDLKGHSSWSGHLYVAVRGLPQ